MACRTRALALALLTLSLCTPPVSAQEPAPPPQDEIFADSIDVNIEVSVTDRRGSRVTGLTRDDFEP